MYLWKYNKHGTAASIIEECAQKNWYNAIQKLHTYKFCWVDITSQPELRRQAIGDDLGISPKDIQRHAIIILILLGGDGFSVSIACAQSWVLDGGTDIRGPNLVTHRSQRDKLAMMREINELFCFVGHNLRYLHLRVWNRLQKLSFLIKIIFCNFTGVQRIMDELPLSRDIISRHSLYISLAEVTH